MNPYLSNLEYSHYTMRGGPGGLDTAYAQGWSFHPWEIFSLIIPNLFGGINQTYWGYMPFTQVYNYFGLLVLVLGLVALSTPKHRRLAIFLWITSVLFTIMSFGSFAPIISGLLLKYLPYFNKFRVPSMILTMVQINAVLLTGLGLDALKEKAEAKEAVYTKRLFIWFWVLGGIFLIWLTLAKALLGGMPFTNAAEIAQYQNAGRSVPADLIATRLDMMYKSGIISLLIATVGMGLAYLRQIGKLKNLAFSLLILVAVFLDLWIYTGKHLDKLETVEDYQRLFDIEDYQQVMIDDTTPHRVYPIGNLPKTTGEWAYHHDLINGYSAAKLKRYDEFIKLTEGETGEFQRYLNGLFNSEEVAREIPMPVLNMLNTKYFILPFEIPFDSLLTKIQPVSHSDDRKVVVYENLGALPRAWFVDEVRHVTEAESILGLMAEESFDPRRVAYVESPVEGIAKPETTEVKQTKAELHELEYSVSTDEDAFLVLSEVYYPAGWSATLDGKELPIYPVNYVLRGLKIPKGEHQLRLVFAPASYKRGITLSLIGILLALIALVGGLVLKYVKRPQPEQIIS
ncbi:MAG: YfhO family protein [Candidatus Cloacimonetes bacterium]|nr:YfhO family protein [Candidatus Cloacimonadota bacterium]